MLRIDRSEKKFVRLMKSALSHSEHWERDLQNMICAEPEAFCEEIGESLWIIGQEVQPSDAIADCIDILALDESGCTVVIELKRGSHKLQLLQATSYAGMVSKWSADRFIETLATNYRQSSDDARSAIEDHVGSDISAINDTQRILLIAEDFDPALLVATEWLHENFGIDIRCYRLLLSQEGSNDYLTCTCIYPPVEIATLTRGGEGKIGSTATAWTSWDAALGSIENAVVRAFVQSELAKHQEARLAYREVIYRIGGKRRFWLGCRKKYAYVWQRGRFDDDISYWRKILSEPNQVQPVKNARDLRFHLTTDADFSAFAKAVTVELLKIEFWENGDLDHASAEE